MLTIDTERENDERWLAEVPELPGVLAYGRSHAEAVHNVKLLALQVLADRLEQGEQAEHMRDLFKEEAA